MKTNRFGSLASLEPALQALIEVLNSIMTKNRPQTKTYRHALLQQPIQARQLEKKVERSFWRRTDSRDEVTGRVDRYEIVKNRIAELKRLSSFSKPLCFRCSDQGHVASQCQHAVLCFMCNKFGHRSAQCRAIVAIPIPRTQISDPRPSIAVFNPHTTQISTLGSHHSSHCCAVLEPPHPTPPLPAQPPLITNLTKTSLPLTPPRSGSSEQYDERLIMKPIKRLKMELTAIEQEVTMLHKRKSDMEKELAGKTDELHTTQNKLAEMIIAQTVQCSVLRERQKEIDKGAKSDEISSELFVHTEMVGDDRKVLLHGESLQLQKSIIQV